MLQKRKNRKLTWEKHSFITVWKDTENEDSGQFIASLRVLLLSLGMQAVATGCGFVSWRLVCVCPGWGAAGGGLWGLETDAAGLLPPCPWAPRLCQAVPGQKWIVAGLARMCLPLQMKEFALWSVFSLELGSVYETFFFSNSLGENSFFDRFAHMMLAGPAVVLHRSLLACHSELHSCSAANPGTLF